MLFDILLLVLFVVHCLVMDGCRSMCVVCWLVVICRLSFVCLMLMAVACQSFFIVRCCSVLFVRCVLFVV